MNELIGSPGTVSGSVLRMGQCAFAAASIAIMISANGFASYSAFCYLIASMGLQVLWSFGLACLDLYAFTRKRDLRNPVLVSLLVLGDWVTALLSLAAACSSAGVLVLYARDLNFCKVKENLACSQFEISIILAFLTWLLIGASSHVTFRLLASV